MGNYIKIQLKLVINFFSKSFGGTLYFFANFFDTAELSLRTAAIQYAYVFYVFKFCFNY